jgi:hypothetical protein
LEQRQRSEHQQQLRRNLRHQTKENIVDANSQWDDLKALQVRNYNFKEGQTHTQIGLVAQEVELVSPGLVSESPTATPKATTLAPSPNR